MSRESRIATEEVRESDESGEAVRETVKMRRREPWEKGV